tara:strand:+ start:3608 stop:4744 length:1137 start_codon:yes stop_codon:yes gene_type:complete
VSDDAARQRLRSIQRVVIKVGSALLNQPDTGLAKARIDELAEQIHELLEDGVQVVLVSSGAVAEGLSRLGMRRRPSRVHELQAAAAVGQMGLVQAYEQAFAGHGRHTAMVLLTHDDLANRKRYLNARATLTRLLALGVIPVINENDTVATDEIRFGDNDTLAALVANLLQADLLFILTDTDGLHEADPRVEPQAALVSEADVAESRLDEMVGEGVGALGRGGMVTKLSAARIAARSGAHTLIASGNEPQVVRRALAGESLGTLLVASVTPLDARKGWIAGQLRVKGDLQLDEGAARALRSDGVSLLPVGVRGVSGDFSRGDLVRCLDPSGQVVAQGLINYGSGDTAKLMGVGSGAIAERIGYSAEPELIHRDNLVLLD